MYFQKQYSLLFIVEERFIDILKVRLLRVRIGEKGCFFSLFLLFTYFIYLFLKGSRWDGMTEAGTEAENKPKMEDPVEI